MTTTAASLSVSTKPGVADDIADQEGPPPAPRSLLRAVALPSEHGGWGLSAEPVLLGLLVSASVAGVFLGAATIVAFLLRTPLRIVLVDRRRGRRLDRTRMARRVVLVEGSVLAALVAAAALTTTYRFWWPLLAAAPLVGVELWFDMRSRSRRLLPELAGAIGVCAAAAVIVIAAGAHTAVAVGVWLILAARSASSIPHVRHQIARLHHRSTTPRRVAIADAAAVTLVAAAIALDPAFIAGAISVVALITLQWATARRDTPVKVLGVAQMISGLTIVIVTAVGLHLA